MKRIILSFYSFALFPALLFAQDLQRIEDEIQFQAKDSFMGSVAISEGDRIILNKGYGFANVEWNIANTSTTKFRLASITKQFTAASILLLEERGLLSTDDAISKHLSNSPESWKSISINNLLTHTSGIPNNFSYESDEDKYKPFSISRDIDRAKSQQLEFEPGSNFRYSNTGYWVLGAIIEAMTKKPYADFIESNIFDPVEMNNSGYESNLNVIPGMASGYSGNDAELRAASYIDMSRPYSAGGLYSTVDDLLKWSKSLFDGELLSPDSMEKLTTVFMGGHSMGLYVQNYNGRTKLWHTGRIDGFNTALAYLPERDITIAVLSNVEGGSAEHLISEIEYVLYEEPVLLDHEKFVVELPLATLKKFEGTYEIENQGGFVVNVENGVMSLQIEGVPESKQTLTPISETIFYPEFPFMHYQFYYDESGVPDRLSLFQRGSTFTFDRK